MTLNKSVHFWTLVSKFVKNSKLKPQLTLVAWDPGRIKPLLISPFLSPLPPHPLCSSHTPLWPWTGLYQGLCVHSSDWNAFPFSSLQMRLVSFWHWHFSSDQLSRTLLPKTVLHQVLLYYLVLFIVVTNFYNLPCVYSQSLPKRGKASWEQELGQIIFFQRSNP